MEKMALRKENRKDNVVIMRVTKEEKEGLKKIAKANNLNLTDLLKLCINQQLQTFKEAN